MNKILKFLIYIVGYCIYPFSFFFPRSKKKWAFGSFRSAFNDNAKYLFIYLSERYPNNHIAWISGSKQTVKHIRSLGFKAYFIGSLRGLYNEIQELVYKKIFY